MPHLKLNKGKHTWVFRTQALRTAQILSLLSKGFTGTDLQIANKASDTLARSTTYTTLQRLVEQGLVVEDNSKFPRTYSFMKNKGVVVSYERPDGFFKMVTIFTIALPDS